jgi:hypothetical protein
MIIQDQQRVFLSGLHLMPVHATGVFNAARIAMH